MIYPPFFDDKKSFWENYKQGPFNAFADGKSYKKSGEPKFDFFGNKLFTPFGISTGPIASPKAAKAAFEKGFDLNIYKSVRSRRLEGNAMPQMLPVNINGDLTLEMSQNGVEIGENYSDPIAATNSFGIPSVDPQDWQQDIKLALTYASKGQKLICAVQGTPKEGGGTIYDYIDDYVHTTKLVKETGADIIEVNFSCPNEGKSDLLCYDIDTVAEICRRIKEEVGNTTILIKTAYYKNEADIEKLVNLTGDIIQGYSLINTIGSKVVDKMGNPAFGENRAIAGVSGAPIKWAGLDMVRKFDKQRKEKNMSFKIIGVGGVVTPNDYKEYLDSGADAVMSAVGAIWNPYLAQEIWEEYYMDDK